MRSQIKAIIFDLSETLIDTQNFFRGRSIKVNQEILRSYGIYKSLSEIEKAVKRVYRKTEKYWKKKLSFSYLLCKELKIDVPLKFAKNMDDKFREEFVKSVQLKRNVKKVLRKLAKKYTLVVLSNYDNKTNQKILSAFGIKKYFKLIVGIDTTGFEKARKIPFLYVLKRLRVKPREVVMVGDNEKQDILPAKLLGIKTIKIVKNLSESTAADFKVKKLDEITYIIFC